MSQIDYKTIDVVGQPTSLREQILQNNNAMGNFKSFQNSRSTQDLGVGILSGSQNSKIRSFFVCYKRSGT